MNDKKIAKWTVSVGGYHEATLLIMQTLKCSPSKAEKIASGRYQCRIPHLEMQALMNLTQSTLDELFPPVRRRISQEA